MQASRRCRRVGTTSGAKVLAETFPARLSRGAGLPAVERLGYLAEFAQMQLDGLEHLVLVDTVSPVSFFAYPDKASDLVPEGCVVHTLAAGGQDARRPRSVALAEELEAAPDATTPAAAFRPDRPTGALTAETFAAAVGALLPEGAIVADEGNTSGLFVSGMTAGAPAHDWMRLTGGAIGYGMPVATGAAIACRDRKVLNLQADGSAMYTLQALWTQAREGLDVTTVILNNRSYAILNLELSRVGAEPGPKALEMLDLTNPDMDFVSMAQGMGVTSSRATTAEEFTRQLEEALATPGPALVEAVLPPLL
ncbi:MAG: acetolactate synthase large subunit [Microthrixaceae bacterium]